jgi:hypothetical protein
MKAFGLQQLVLLFINWKESQQAAAENEEPTANS